MWQDGLKVGELRTPVRHADDVLIAQRNEASKKASSVDCPEMLKGFNLFQAAGHSVFEVFHDILQ